MKKWYENLISKSRPAFEIISINKQEITDNKWYMASARWILRDRSGKSGVLALHIAQTAFPAEQKNFQKTEIFRSFHTF
jgi:hypothetical protein